ncbi:hypothetical protein F1880_008996 [Penicillium rolfsii]|nr:hypothetical protein F1880_008996 [Penicillium rolfsii]
MPTPHPTTELEANMPKSESQAAAELSDTGFYRQRAELAAHSQSELINVPLDRRRRKSPPNPGSSPLSSTGSGRGSGGNKSSARSADDKSGSIPLTSRHTAQRVVTKDGIVMGANLDRHSMVYDPERVEAKGGKKDDAGQEHVMSFMAFGGSEFEMIHRKGSASGDRGSRSGSGSGGSDEREGGSLLSVSQAVPGIVLENVGAFSIGEAPPAYDARGVPSPQQDDKSPCGGEYRIGD